MASVLSVTDDQQELTLQQRVRAAVQTSTYVYMCGRVHVRRWKPTSAWTICCLISMVSDAASGLAEPQVSEPGYAHVVSVEDSLVVCQTCQTSLKCGGEVSGQIVCHTSSLEEEHWTEATVSLWAWFSLHLQFSPLYRLPAKYAICSCVCWPRPPSLCPLTPALHFTLWVKWR